MSGRIIHKRSLTPGSIPTTSSLEVGELAINVDDGKIFLRRSGSGNNDIIPVVTANTTTIGTIIATSFTGSFTGSLFGTASWAQSASQALTASFYQETDPIFTAVSASLATTGSNNFDGNQSITGSLTISGGLGLVASDINGNSLDVNNRWLTTNNSISVDWGNRILIDSTTSTTASLDWENKILIKYNGSDYVPVINWNDQTLIANDGITTHLNWSNPSYIGLPSITESPITNVLGIDGSGRLFYTASDAIGGGGGGSAFPYTGSAIISGSLVVTGSTISTLGFTGSLFGTASWAQNAITASFLPVGTYQITSSWAQSASQAITASYVNGSIFTGTNPALSSSYALSSSFAATASFLIGGGTGIVSINSLTSASQTLITGSSGNDFSIISSGDTHTFNLPTASISSSGKLSSTDWINFNNGRKDTFAFGAGGTNPLDNLTYYIGGGVYITSAWTTTAGVRRTYVSSPRTITEVNFAAIATNNASGESVQIYVRVNNTTDYTISTTFTMNAGANAYNLLNVTGSNIPLSANDYWEIKIVCPAWATNPTAVAIQGAVTYTY
jgi:hypothetical protein